MAETIIIGDREFTCHPMNAFAANRILMRIQKIVTPILGSLAGGGTKSLVEMDVKEAAKLLAEHVDESIMDSIVLPMFAESKVYANEKKKFLKTASDIDQVFTIEDLFDLYELVWEVGRIQFAPFFVKMSARLGGLLNIESPKTA